MYHIISRGNYRSDVFEAVGAKKAFEECLFEACEKTGWRLHAYVVMSNHYHLALETPQANLVEGMKWLQSTYANRFNRFRSERGHVFQGRYNAIVVEDSRTLGAVGHYIHLNPVNAKMESVATLANYRYGSYRYLTRKAERPPALDGSSVLLAAGQLADSNAGWTCYEAYLTWLMENETARKALGFEKMCRGWALGSAEFKKDLARDLEEKAVRATPERETQELRELQWESLLRACLKKLAVDPALTVRSPKSADWKVAIAAHLRQVTTANLPWITEKLHAGSPQAMSRYVAECKHGRRKKAQKLMNRLQNVKGSV
ncbi:MAG TPA: transposase [Opitutaceae bacterium]|nr:transposase [Opitutaceae bacterium]